MTILDPFQSRQVFWEIYVQGIDMSNLKYLKQSISDIEVIYEIAKPTIAIINFTAISTIVDLFRTGHNVVIKFGYQPTSMVVMISGKCTVEPAGSAEETVKAQARIVDGIFKMTKKETSKDWGFMPTRNAIVMQLIVSAGLVPNVQMKKGLWRLDLKEIPKQIKMTDLQFLYKCAKKWNCIVWKEDKIIYFVDADKAHDIAGLARILHKKVNIKDLSPYYFLNFRTFFNKNNVKSVSWSYKKVGGKPKQSSMATRETSIAVDYSSYDIEAYGKIWIMKLSIAKNPKIAKSSLAKIVMAVKSGEFERAKEFLNEYYVLQSDTDDDSRKSRPFHKGGNLEINIILNKGDPYLRAPRKGSLTCGDGQRGTLQLPHHILRGDTSADVYMNRVATKLTNGIISTSISASQGRR